MHQQTNKQSFKRKEKKKANMARQDVEIEREMVELRKDLEVVKQWLEERR